MNESQMIGIMKECFRIRNCVVIGWFAALGSACSPQQMYEAQLNKPNPLPKSAQCPAPGSPMPFSQVWSEANHVVGCDVMSQVVLIGALEGCPRRLVVSTGQRCFNIVAPTEYSAGAVSPMANHIMLVPKENVSILYQTKSGTTLDVRGVMAVDEDFGSLAFAASGVRATPATATAPVSQQ